MGDYWRFAKSTIKSGVFTTTVSAAALALTVALAEIQDPEQLITMARNR
jgi:hypothetical protein